MTKEEKMYQSAGYFPGLAYNNGVVYEPVVRVTEEGFYTQPDGNEQHFYGHRYYRPARHPE